MNFQICRPLFKRWVLPWGINGFGTWFKRALNWRLGQRWDTLKKLHNICWISNAIFFIRELLWAIPASLRLWVSVMFNLLSVKLVYSSIRFRYNFWQIMKSFVISCSQYFLLLQCWDGRARYHSSNEFDWSHELDCSPSHRARSQYEQVSENKTPFWCLTSIHVLQYLHLGMLFIQPDSSYFLTFSFFNLLCFYTTTPAWRSSCQALFIALQAWCLLIWTCSSASGRSECRCTCWIMLWCYTSSWSSWVQVHMLTGLLVQCWKDYSLHRWL